MKRLFGKPLKVLGFLTILLGLFLTFLFLYFDILGPIAVVIGLLLYLFNAILERFIVSGKKFSAAQIASVILYLCFCSWAFLKLFEHNSIVFPGRYQGEAGIIFGIKGYPPLPETNFGRKIIEIPENGIVITSTKAEEIPQSVQFYFQDNSPVNYNQIEWRSDVKTDCLVNDSQILAWLFTVDKVEDARVRNKVSGLCSEISQGNAESFYKDKTPPDLKAYSNGTLDLQNRRLSSLPDEVSKLNISSVILTGNDFTEFPKPILENQNIEELTIAVNPLRTIPAEINNLVRLKSLSVDATQISDIDVDFSKMKLLENFSISRNKLENVPEAIKSIPNLRELHLNDNNLESLSFVDERLKKLEKLDLYTNKITALTKETKYLTNLKELNIFDNQIESITGNISDLVNLEYLEIWGNPIKSISPEIRHLKKLKSMRIDDNYLTETDKQNLRLWLPNCEIAFQTGTKK